MLTVPSFHLSKNQQKRLAVLTSGGDAPGMNAAIRSVVRFGIAHGCEVFGIQKGYSGLLEGQIHPLGLSSVANIIQRGGTVLKTDRCEAFYKKTVRREAANILKRKNIDGLVVIGGDGSFAGAHLMEMETGFPSIGIPGTIDNDIAETEDTIGFDTAVNAAVDAIDRIRDTASSHDRIFLVEVMGRASGFIALQVGIGGGAETVLMPERKRSLPEIVETIKRGIARGKTSSIIVVAEGDNPGHSARLAQDLSKHGFNAKVCILGHTQRGGSPTAHDRLLASAMGAAAVAGLLTGKSNGMIGVQNGRLITVPYKKVIGRKKDVSDPLIALAQILSS